MHAHVLASPPCAEGLRKHLTELNAFRISNSEEAERRSLVGAAGLDGYSSGDGNVSGVGLGQW